MFVVTAPTGNIGSQVVQNLLDRDVPVRVVARDPSRLPGSTRTKVDVVTGSHSDPAVIDEACAGAEGVFWLVPPQHQVTDLLRYYLDFTRPAAGAFVKHGVARVVGVSALGRGTPWERDAGHVTAVLAMDDLIAATGVPYRALANPSFMENTLAQLPSITGAGVISSPEAPDRRMPICATADIAAVATRLLLDDGWTGHGEVPVLGPEDLSGDDRARIISEVLGLPVRYRQTPADEFEATLRSHGMSEEVARNMRQMMLAKDAGLDNGVVRTPEFSTPTTFREWCEKALYRFQ
ncbi:NmrA family transcriptional regulator [Actinoplanes ianthinogenes]|uniref:NmrA family transcriptional regulator n=1 Tax=Actinoplanes ianthinogenes TaxID=122358 RepID=A0ABN6CR88_9ACTN|nr:NAD(P)H-binding protein [Actinoplanes ianthinogenes]BCJ47753.1 NmrA family transcriptional regulator [Actinoplanes ianthinogenes]GGR03938.1 NmrA family transcriptional regulator [Actinoplanes ianthinogenes]